jgi:hypothetical protein
MKYNNQFNKYGSAKLSFCPQKKTVLTETNIENVKNNIKESVKL